MPRSRKQGTATGPTPPEGGATEQTRPPRAKKTTSAAAGAAGPTTKTPRRRAPATGRTETGRRGMSDEHREAMRSGRDQTRAVRAYLEALEVSRPRRGPRPDPTKMRTRIAAIGTELAAVGPLERVALHQERIDLERQLETIEQRDRLDGLERDFVAAVGEYSRRHGISADAWLAVGVPRDALKRAGVL